ncbi:Aspartic endopeptidase [Trichoderma simmonsii]|uniref:Aspartic endopeptidase n=1 Tax=Trichoderma simmonsii TaxID=1491479 RepID=A0A8G0PK64_9HYPO|nr:Aspartic endopeptidase [Trichoderma simmonsii]
MPGVRNISAALLLAGQAAVNNLPDNVFNVPLTRIMNLEYYGMEFEVGNPPQRSFLKIDTGSPTIGFISPRSNMCLRPEHPCHPLGTYDNLTSSTAVVAFPGSYPNYNDGLLDGGRGIFVNDTLRFAGVCVDDFVLGSTDSFNLDVRLSQSNPFAGIMGLNALCFGSQCDVYPTLVQQLSDRDILKTRAFSIYLGQDEPHATGHLLLGGVDEAKRDGPVFTQKLDSPWEVEYSSFTLDKDGEKTVWPIEPGNTVSWDTGAAYFGLPTAVFNAVAAVLELPANVTSTQDPYEVDCKHRDIVDTVLEVGFPGNGTIKIPVGRLVTTLDSGKCVTYALNGIGGSGETDFATNFGAPFLRSVYATYNLDTLELTYSQVKYTDEEQIVAIPAAN